MPRLVLISQVETRKKEKNRAWRNKKEKAGEEEREKTKTEEISAY